MGARPPWRGALDRVRGERRSFVASVTRRHGRPLTAAEERLSTPWWLLLTFIGQALGWLVQVGFVVLFLVYASGSVERSLEISLLVAQLVVAVTATGAFVIAAVRPIRGSVSRRFALTHWAIGLLVVMPLVAAGLYQAVERGTDGRWGDAVSTGVIMLGVALIPVGGGFASTRENRTLVIIAGALGLLWVVFHALFFLGLGAGMAGISA